MASCPEKSVPGQCSCTSHSCASGDKPLKAEKIQDQEQSSAEKPKINRLKRANWSRKSDLGLSEGQVLITDHEKRSQISTVKSTMPPNTCVAPRPDLVLSMKTSMGPNKLTVKSGSSVSSHQQSILVHEGGALRRRESRTERSDLHQHEESESENKMAFHYHARSSPESLSRRARGHLQHQVQAGVLKWGYCSQHEADYFPITARP